MKEVLASLIGAIVGSVITLIYAHWHEWSAHKMEQQILRNTLLEECQLQMGLLEEFEKYYAQPQYVHPARISIDLFAYAINRHVAILGDVKLIKTLSLVILHSKALNTVLDRYEAILAGTIILPRMGDVESLRIVICHNIKLCKKGLDELQKMVKLKLFEENHEDKH